MTEQKNASVSPSDKTMNQEHPWYKDRWEVRPMNDSMAKGLLNQGDDMSDNLSLSEIANIQAAIERTPEAFNDAQREKIKNLSWKMIDRVASGDFWLDPRQCNQFKFIMDNVPAEVFNDENRLKTLKAAEQKWYDADTMTGERELLHLTPEEFREGLKTGRIKRNIPKKGEKAGQGKSSSVRNMAKKIRELQGLSPRNPSRPVQNLHVQQRTISQPYMPRTGGRV